MSGIDWEKLNGRMQKQQFELGAKEPISWLSTSRGLKHAADHIYDIYYAASEQQLRRIVEEVESGQIQKSQTLLGKELEEYLDCQLLPVYLMLMGFSLENLLKGIVIRQQPELLKPDGSFNLKSHKLVILAQMGNIQLLPEEESTLETLTTATEWASRYSVPLKQEDMFPKKLSDDTWKQRGYAYDRRKTQEKVTSLWEKFYQELMRA